VNRRLAYGVAAREDLGGSTCQSATRLGTINISEGENHIPVQT